MKHEAMVDMMIEEMTQGADGSDAKCGVIGEIGCSWPLQGKNKGEKVSNQGNLRGESGLFFTSVLTLWNSSHIGGQVWIWHDHSAQSALIIVAV